MAVRLPSRYHRAMPDAGSEERFSAALAAIAAACEEGRRESHAAADMMETWRRANRLREAIDGERGVMARWRAKTAARIWHADRLSLAELARKLGMSKARADQMIRMAREDEGECL